jgi:hypothetical protein
MAQRGLTPVKFVVHKVTKAYKAHKVFRVQLVIPDRKVLKV